MTSAPKSLKTTPAAGPKTMVVSSKTLMPSSRAELFSDINLKCFPKSI